jgi:hypothetical protein
MTGASRTARGTADARRNPLSTRRQSLLSGHMVDDVAEGSLDDG